MQLRRITFATLVAAVPGVAAAQGYGSYLPSFEPAPRLEGLYIGAGVGANWLQNQNINGPTGGLFSKPALSAGIGMAGVASVGYAFPNGIRVELEGDLRNNPISGSHNTRFQADGGGRVHTYGPMVNVLYDFSNIMPTPWFAPYAGVGLGYQWARQSGTHITAFPSGSPELDVGGTQGAFAYQFILGGGVPIPAVRGLAMTMEYRFLGVNSRNYGATIRQAGFAPTPTTVKFDNEYNHAVLIGLRYNFLPPPPPPPAPAPIPAAAPARSYLVFFDWDKANLTDRARQIIAEAATNSTRVQVTRIEVNGYTDTSGTPKYNQGLSVRRARAVQAELIKDGVPANIITIQGFGDTNLLVPTGPGVREPQNRRVEIIIK